MRRWSRNAEIVFRGSSESVDFGHNTAHSGCYRPVSIYHDQDDVESYQSLVIFFETKPEDDELAVVAERAKKFCAERPDYVSKGYTIEPLQLRAIKLMSNEVLRKQEIISQVFPKSS